jgi:hypothetical protein
VVLDHDHEGNPMGIDIDKASTKVELDTLVVSKLSATIERLG